MGTQGNAQEPWSPEAEQPLENAWADESRDARSAQTSGNPGPAPEAPAVLRPGNPGNYSDFEQEEEVIWGAPLPKPAEAPTAGKAPSQPLSHVPTVLRPGGANPPRAETNPFKRKPAPSTDQQTNQVVPPMPSSNPPPLPPPVVQFSNMDINESSTNPWQPTMASGQPAPAASTPIPDTSDQGSGINVWSSQDNSREPSRKPSKSNLSGPPVLLSMPSDEGSAGWNDVPPQPPPPSKPPAPIDSVDEEEYADRHAWDDVGLLDKGKTPAVLPAPSMGAGTSTEGWSLIDAGTAPGQLSRQSTWEDFGDEEEASKPEKGSAPVVSASRPDVGPSGEPPALPPRSSTEGPPPRPPRPAGADRTETYAIKNITWQDANAPRNPRTSPILVQNANGPCPLVALVNALTLTTPADLDTALVEILRTREQVSLELLLNAVFDELMSPRRTTGDSELPDVTELYAFLKGLHTGMNVNPRFIPTQETMKAFKRTSLAHLHPTERGDMIPGTFEDTKEMKLYATFSIPLIHGWIPPREDEVYAALERCAASYEDVQNILFREEELEEKLSSPTHQGLSEEEQELYQDILTIKSFLSVSATQLTPWGLEVLTKAIRPGSVAILFRNDHFSTLYRHPQTLELFGLVTDAGYAGHAEVVWETLCDVNGEQSEFFSGDFRLVGGANQFQQGSGSANRTSGSYPGTSSAGDEWTAVHEGSGRDQQPSSQNPPLSPAHEQEDRDLAFALQLQEEEDERHRAEQARRRRESHLSQQFIEQQANQPATAGRGRGGTPVLGRGGRDMSNNERPRRSSGGVSIPVTSTSTNSSTASFSTAASNRGRGGRVAQVVRPLVPPPGSTRLPTRQAEDGSDDAPPSYEQAASQTAYDPPSGHPSHPSSSPNRRSASVSSPSRPPNRLIPPIPIGTNTGNTNSSGSRPQPGPSSPLRPGASPIANGPPGPRDKDCVVM